MTHISRCRLLSYSFVTLGAVLGLVVTFSRNTDDAVLHGAAVGGIVTGQSSEALPDLSVIRTVPATAPWDGFLDVRYVVENRGGRVAQANIVEPYVSASYDAARRVMVPAPISFYGVIPDDLALANSVRCAPVGGVIRCLLSSGLDTGGSIGFVVRYVVPQRSIQCDASVTLAAATITKGLVGSYPVRPNDIARQDLSPADNVAPAASTRIDCASITGDMSVAVSGPSSVAPGATGEYVVTVSNVGTVRSVVPAVQVTLPASGYDIVSATGLEQGGMCLRMNKIDAGNQRTCVNPSVMLEPGATVSYSIVLRASQTACVAGTVAAAITTDMSRPTPTFTQIFETNVSNNAASVTVACDGGSGGATTSSSSTSSSVSTSSSSVSSVSSSSSSFVSSVKSKSASSFSNPWYFWWGK